MNEAIIKIDSKEGVQSIERINRAVIMMTDAAIQKLIESGSSRDNIEISIDENSETLVSLKLNKKTVYEIKFIKESDSLKIYGIWKNNKKDSWLSRLIKILF